MDIEKKLGKAADYCINSESNSITPLVTIGVTNYNCKDYLEQCIDSILNQSFKSVEIIIADDDSRDGSVEKIRSFEMQHKNIRAIYHSQNSGSPDLGRQEILDSARGKYFMLVDSDDYFADIMTVEILLEELKKSPELDYVYCNMLVVDKSDKQSALWAYRQYTDQEIIRDTFQRGGSGVIPMKGMFRRDFFIKNDLCWQSNETAGDTLSALVYTKHGWKYKYLDLNLLCYRQYEDSFTFNLEKRIKAVSRILDYITDNFSEEIYFTKIPWNQLKALTRYNIKMYLLGQFYYELLNVYYSQWHAGSSLQKEDKNKFIESLIPLKNKVSYYFSQCLTPHLFSSNMENILRDIEAMMKYDASKD